MKRALALGAVTGLLAFGIAPAAHAGEITGGPNPKPTPIKTRGVAASECAFSGLDDLTEPGSPSWDTRPRRTQNYGQVPREERAFMRIELGLTPGQFCNPNWVPPMPPQ